MAQKQTPIPYQKYTYRVLATVTVFVRPGDLPPSGPSVSRAIHRRIFDGNKIPGMGEPDIRAVRIVDCD